MLIRNLLQCMLSSFYPVTVLHKTEFIILLQWRTDCEALTPYFSKKEAYVIFFFWQYQKFLRTLHRHHIGFTRNTEPSETGTDPGSVFSACIRQYLILVRKKFVCRRKNSQLKHFPRGLCRLTPTTTLVRVQFRWTVLTLSGTLLSRTLVKKAFLHY